MLSNINTTNLRAMHAHNSQANSHSTELTQTPTQLQSDHYITSPHPSPKIIQPHFPPQEQQAKPLSEKLWGAIRGTIVGLTAAIITGALMASGVGLIGVGIAILAGIFAGTAIGALTNAITCSRNGDWSKFWDQTFDDFKSSCVCAISTAAGFGVARLITGTGQVAAKASVSRRLWANTLSGITNTGVSYSTNLGFAYSTARKDFKEFLKQNNLEHYSDEEKARLYQDFLQQHKLDTRSILKSFGFAILTSAISRRIGSKFQLSRDQAILKSGLNPSRLQTTRSLFTEATILSGISLGSGTLEHGRNLPLENKVSTIFGNYAGGITGHYSSNYIQSKIQPRINPGQASPIPIINNQK